MPEQINDFEQEKDEILKTVLLPHEAEYVYTMIEKGKLIEPMYTHINNQLHYIHYENDHAIKHVIDLESENIQKSEIILGKNIKREPPPKRRKQERFNPPFADLSDKDMIGFFANNHLHTIGLCTEARDYIIESAYDSRSSIKDPPYSGLPDWSIASTKPSYITQRRKSAISSMPPKLSLQEPDLPETIPIISDNLYELTHTQHDGVVPLLTHTKQYKELHDVGATYLGPHKPCPGSRFLLEGKVPLDTNCFTSGTLLNGQEVTLLIDTGSPA